MNVKILAGITRNDYVCKRLTLKVQTMRFRITLQLQPEVKGNAIPINYQYPLQAAIYRTLSRSDADFSQWLHDNGYQLEKKRFKLFTFSNLIVPQFGIDKHRERLIIESDTVTLFISFLPEKSTQQFIQGIFAEQIIQIADYISGAQFIVREIQVMKPLEYHPEMIFQTLSPVCVSLRNDHGRMDYIHPSHQLYESGILAGLLWKYQAIYGHEYEGEKYCHLNVLSEPKSSLVRIKAGTPNETRIRGYRYRACIDLPEPLMQIAYESGLGEKGSMGFGMIDVLPNSKN